MAKKANKAGRGKDKY
jgi:cell division protein FtsJ